MIKSPTALHDHAMYIAFIVLLIIFTVFTPIRSESLVFVPHKAKNIPCPDKKGSCPPDSTCCLKLSGDYGCCPLPEATCCSDHIHCCPNMYQCDVAHERCIRGDGTFTSWAKKHPAFPVTNEVQVRGKSVVCPDKEYQCADNQTCCKLTTGQWACCPEPLAVCCEDHIHCCPHGYTCDVQHATCLHDSHPDGPSTLPWLMYVSSTVVSYKDIKCDDKVRCLDTQTCCMMVTGQYGCCPLAHAVCCEDKTHCCPEGYKCNVEAGTCELGSNSVPWSTKIEGISDASDGRNSDIKTPINDEGEISEKDLSGKECGGNVWCDENKTCCESHDGKLQGCCPFKNAQCCGDGLHCCPLGSKCDGKSGMCRSIDSSVSFTWNLIAHIAGRGLFRPVLPVSLVKCPDNATCPANTTCCMLSNKQYRCCPYDSAVCCADQVHCCPHSMTCNEEKSRCDFGSMSVPWEMFTRRRTLHVFAVEAFRDRKLSTDTCPDLKSLCPDNTTCCEMRDKGYGCCPWPNAVCCSDKLGCCPYGTTCDIERQSCISSKEDPEAGSSTEVQNANKIQRRKAYSVDDD